MKKSNQQIAEEAKALIAFAKKQKLPLRTKKSRPQ